MMDARVILYHKQAASARTRFLRHAHHSVCAFEPLPARARLTEAEVAWHPAAAVGDAARRLGLARDGLEIQADFRASVETDRGVIPLFLARFTSIDPPFEIAARLDAEFIHLTQARDLDHLELDVLRRAYEIIMGG